MSIKYKAFAERVVASRLGYHRVETPFVDVCHLLSLDIDHSAPVPQVRRVMGLRQGPPAKDTPCPSAHPFGRPRPTPSPHAAAAGGTLMIAPVSEPVPLDKLPGHVCESAYRLAPDHLRLSGQRQRSV